MRVSRVRRYGAASLPIRASPTSPSQRVSASNTVSCWYCDLKIFALNEPLFRFGRKHAEILKLWFSIGMGFGLTALVGVTLVLLWQLFLSSDTQLSNLFSSLLFGFSPSIRISLSDAGYIFVSTLASVSVHEIGHAIALASEGIQLDYIAIFLAVLFPGALVAFDYDLMQALPRVTALRVYCAGIWHNAVFCAVCGFLLFLQPVILYPFYIHTENPLVLDIAPASPLSEFLSPGDAIVSLDGVQIRDMQHWMKISGLLNKKILQNSNGSHYGTIDTRKGYCVPNAMLEDSEKVQWADNPFVCPNNLASFVRIHCVDPGKSEDVSDEDGQQGRRENKLCLNAKDIVKLEKCGDGWGTAMKNGSRCMCSQGESCLSPIQFPGLMWVEITYSMPYSTNCLQHRSSLLDLHTSDAAEQNCGGTFVFVGDVISMAHSVQLTIYRPRWRYFLGEYLPNKLEKSLLSTFHVSLTLALLNSLPVYFLDGESILEVNLSYFTWLSPRKRKNVLQICLVGGTCLSVLAFLRIFFIKFLYAEADITLRSCASKAWLAPFGNNLDSNIKAFNIYNYDTLYVMNNIPSYGQLDLAYLQCKLDSELQNI